MNSKDTVMGAVVVALLTAGAAPWWWEKLAQTGTQTDVRRAAQEKLIGLAPALPVPSPEVEKEPDAPSHGRDPLLNDADRDPSWHQNCPGQWALQMGAGHDREGLKRVVDKVRAAGGPFRETQLYTSSSGTYKVVIGCLDRFTADELSDSFIEHRILHNKPLVTQGRSLQRPVY